MAEDSWSFDLPENTVATETLLASSSAFTTSNLAGCLEKYEIIMSDSSATPTELTISPEGLLSIEIGSAVKVYDFGIKVTSERSTDTADDSKTVTGL